MLNYFIIQPINGGTDFYTIAGFESYGDALGYVESYNRERRGEDAYGFPCHIEGRRP